MTLRLADAILLGDSLKKRDAWRYLSRDKSCGCALGGAFLANGGVLAAGSPGEGIKQAWPWLTFHQRATISGMYLRNEPIESIAAYADSIDPTPRCEPPEPSQVEVRQEGTVSHG